MTPIQYIASLRERASEFTADLDEADTFTRVISRAKADSYRLIASEIEQQLDEWELVPENETGYSTMWDAFVGAA